MKAVTEERKARVLEIMTRHVGREKAKIGRAHV